MQVRKAKTPTPETDILMTLQSALANHQTVSITYLSESGDETERSIEPFAILNTQGNWIVIAYCLLRADFRYFRIDRIAALTLTKDHFQPHELTLEAYLENCRKSWNTPDIQLTQGQRIFASEQNNHLMQTTTIAPFHLIGIAIRTTNVNNKSAEEIASLWGRFLSENLISQIPNKAGDEIYSVYTEYEGDHTKPYTAILGCKVHNLKTIPDGMIGKSFDGGQYVKTTAKGDLTKGLIVNEWARIWGMDLDRAYTTDFEVFGEGAQNPSDAVVDFYVAINE